LLFLSSIPHESNNRAKSCFRLIFSFYRAKRTEGPNEPKYVQTKSSAIQDNVLMKKTAKQIGFSVKKYDIS
jgi:hypothetical protein